MTIVFWAMASTHGGTEQMSFLDGNSRMGGNEPAVDVLRMKVKSG